MHTLEAVLIFGVAISLAYFFPEHRTEAGLLAFTVLSSLAKYARVTEGVPVPDFVNGKTK
jgi:hypothetical protein